MKTPEEIKERKLELYDSREKLKAIFDDCEQDNELILAAHASTLAVYNAVIYNLDWVLNDKS